MRLAPAKNGIEETTLEAMNGHIHGRKGLQRTLRGADSLSDTQNKSRESKDQVRNSPVNKVIFIIELL